MYSKSRNASSGTKLSSTSSISKLGTSSFSPSPRYNDDDESDEAAEFWKSSSSEQSLSISELLAAADRTKNSIPSKVLCEPSDISHLAIDDREETALTASLSVSEVFSWKLLDDNEEREGDKAFTSLPESDIEEVSAILVEEVNKAKLAKSAGRDRSSPDLRNTPPRDQPRLMTARISRDKKVTIPVARAKLSTSTFGTFQRSEPTDQNNQHEKRNATSSSRRRNNEAQKSQARTTSCFHYDVALNDQRNTSSSSSRRKKNETKKSQLPTNAPRFHHNMALKWIEEHHRLTPSTLNRSNNTTKEHQHVQRSSRAA